MPAPTCAGPSGRFRRWLGDDVLVPDGAASGLSQRSTVIIQAGEDLTVDALQFQAWIARGRRWAEEETFDGCAQLLTDAVGFYQGDFLAGFSLPDCPDFDEWQFFQAETLRRDLADALQMLIDWHTTQQAYEKAIAHARRWLAMDRLHEPAHQILMRLYAQSGQQAAAVKQYQECECQLAEELHVPPHEQTRTLYEAIRTRQFPDLIRPDMESRREMNASPTTVPRRPPHNLLPLTVSFVGRSKELPALRERIADPAIRLVTIAGPGGIGKTHLALATAHEQLDEGKFMDGVFFVALASFTNRAHVLSAIADSLNLSLVGSRDPEAAFLDQLRSKQILLVLDNFEQLLSEVDLIEQILCRAPKTTLLVTSRERLNLREEWVLDLRACPTQRTQRRRRHSTMRPSGSSPSEQSKPMPTSQ